ncbi:hypothetical protein MKW98_007927 [Papaver atlanticum]|uniref:Uncharacterized protein n=1 Tax=Papaver atlanticum TaxID=357466 RepID=A0AAD4XG09_9MAGN|nr:hypothetical protein MKW98_007927 [Papaver atlanticum]
MYTGSEDGPCHRKAYSSCLLKTLQTRYLFEWHLKGIPFVHDFAVLGIVGCRWSKYGNASYKISKFRTTYEGIIMHLSILSGNS